MVRVRFVFLIVLLRLCSSPALSWSQLPNAYDFFPLAKGNEWIYSVLQFDPSLHRVVAADTLLGDSLTVYEVVEGETRSYYFYDKDSTVVYQSQEFPESVDSGFPFLDTRHGLGVKWIVTYDGITRAFAVKDTSRVKVFDRFWDTAQVYEVDPAPDSLIYLEALGRYAVGLGLIQFGEESLIYARINGVEYGERPTSVQATEKHRIPENFQLRLYPNPVNGAATLLFDSPSLKQIQVKIVNVLGRVVREFTIRPTSVSFQLTWDGRDSEGGILANGAYFAIARYGDRLQAVKFIYLR